MAHILLPSGLYKPSDIQTDKIDPEKMFVNNVDVSNNHIVDELKHINNVTSGGTASALTAGIDEATLVDGLSLILKLSVGIANNATLTLNNGAARNIVTSANENVKSGAVSGSYLQLVYSATINKWVVIDGSSTKEPAIGAKNSAFNKNYESTVSNIKMNGTQAVGTADTIARGDHVHPTDTTREPSIGAKNSAFNKNYESTVSNIKMNGTQAVGTADTIARGDHVHPTDTTRAPLASPALTGTPTVPTAPIGTNTTQAASTGFVNNEIANDAVLLTAKGVANGVATLGSDGKVPSGQLPSYVDDVIEVDLKANLPTTGEQSKIYVVYADTADKNGQYRWTGTVYQLINNPLDYATQSEAEAGTENTKVMTALRSFQAIAKWITSTAIGTLGTLTNTAITASDNVKSALEKIQGQLNAKEPTITKNNAFNKNYEATATNIKMNGTQSVGTTDTIARGDHVHPVDTSREPAITTKNSAFNVNFESTASNIKMNGAQAVGSLSTVARGDHVHPVDTSRASLLNPIPFVTTAGTLPAYTATMSGITLSVGAQLLLKIHATNTATANTLNVNGLGAKPIKFNGQDIAVGMLQINGIVPVVYDGTYWQIQSLDNAFMFISTTGGTGSAYTVTSPGYPVLTTGMILPVKFALANTTTTPTINVNSLGAKTLQRNGSALAVGEICANTNALIVYDGTYFQIFAIESIGGGMLLTGYTKGTDASAIASTDTVNQAFSKVENAMLKKDGSVQMTGALKTVGGDSVSTIKQLDLNDVHLYTRKGAVQAFTCNAYFDGTNWKYIANGTANKFVLANDSTSLLYYYAVSGIKDAVITWIDNSPLPLTGGTLTGGLNIKTPTYPTMLLSILNGTMQSYIQKVYDGTTDTGTVFTDQDASGSYAKLYLQANTTQDNALKFWYKNLGYKVYHEGNITANNVDFTGTLADGCQYQKWE